MAQSRLQSTVIRLESLHTDSLSLGTPRPIYVFRNAGEYLSRARAHCSPSTPPTTMSRADSIETLELGPIAASSSRKGEVQIDSRSSSRQQFEQINIIDPNGSREQLHAEDAERDNVQELAPIDSGWPAWRFVAAGFMVEVMIWGFQLWSVLELRLRFFHEL